MNENHQKLGVGLLALFFIFLIITLSYVNPIVEKRHASYNRTEVIPQYGFYMTNITCPHCGSTDVNPYAAHIQEDNHNKKVTTFFYCRDCSTIFSIRPSR